MSSPRFMSVAEFAEYVGIDESTVRRLMKQGLPHTYITVRNPRVKVDEAIAWCAENAKKNVPNEAEVLH